MWVVVKNMPGQIRGYVPPDVQNREICVVFCNYTSQVEAAVIVLRKVSTTKETTKDSLPKRDSGGKGGRQEAD